MPDPPDDLSDLEGVDVHPLPASEVRARGDRLRRRRTTLAVVGVAVAVVAVTVGVTLLGGGPSDRGAPGPATTSPSQTPGSTEAPDPAPAGSLADEFPLDVGLPETNDDGSPVEVAVRAASEDLVLCGTLAWTPTRAMDLAGTSYDAPEDYRGRTLLLYPSLAAATEAVEQARAALAGCSEEEIGGTDQVYTPVDDDTMGEASVMFSQRYRTGGAFDTGLTLYRLVRVGAALLLTVDYAEANGSAQSASNFLQSTRASTQRLVEEMRVFGGALAPEAGGTIPANFPLDEGQVAMTGDGGQMIGPSPDAPGLGTITLCGQELWPVPPNERLASVATGPEYADLRELVTYLDAEAATNVMTQLRQRLRACPSEQVDGGAGTVEQIHAEQTVDLGYEQVTFAVYLSDGVPGLTVYQFVRVGSAVLALAESSEGISARADSVAAKLTERSRILAPQMCVFAEAGCSPSEPDYLTIGPTGVGPWELGMSIEEALSRGGRLESDGTCPRLSWQPDALPMVSAVVDRGRGIISLSAAESVETPDGVRIGTAFDNLVAAYPDGDGDEQLWTAGTPSGHAYYRFELDLDARVSVLRLVAKQQNCAG